jgi:dynein heavy chain, axonemal
MSEPIVSKDKGKNKLPAILPTGTRGRYWNENISYIPKDVLEHQSPLQKFDQIHAKYLTSPRVEIPVLENKFKRKGNPVIVGVEKVLKREKESLRTKMVNIIMYELLIVGQDLKKTKLRV